VEYLNQSIIEQMESEDLWIWRNNIARNMGKEAVFLSQIDYVLEQRGER
jgi:transcriptional regulator CtsR